MDRIIPWEGLCGVIEPYFPKPEGASRLPVGLERMLRIHFLQQMSGVNNVAGIHS
jgi:IS5 family transposase